MKSSHVLFILIFLSIAACKQPEPFREIIPGPEWKFLPGDDLSRADPKADSSIWYAIDVTKVWDDQGFNKLDGYGWYRSHFFLSKDLKKNSILKDSLLIYLGKIDDYDQVFLNGQLMGENGRVVPPGTKAGNDFIKENSLWYQDRIYKIATNDPRLLWGKKNIIAIRVYDIGGPGGMYGGGQKIKMLDIEDYIQGEYGPEKFLIESKKVIKPFTLRNTSNSITLEGRCDVRVSKQLSGEIIYVKEWTVKLGPEEEMVYKFSLPLMQEPAIVECFYLHGEKSIKVVFQDEVPYILTPEPSPAPSINEPKITGVRPSKPFLFRLPVSGQKPLEYTLSGLPAGLTFDSEKGIISGKVDTPGLYNVGVKVENEAGSDSSIIKIIVGDDIALTPPMGWNSWNCWGLSVDQEKIMDAGRAFIKYGLADHGWSYINIDDGWEIEANDPTPKRDEHGNILSNDKFTDMKGLGDKIHDMGLKFGIYSSPGFYTCGGYTGSYQHEYQDVASYASWGIDYLKYDWCSYGQIAKDMSLPELKKPYFLMNEALNGSDRDIVFSICQYGMGKVWEWGPEVGGNLWRTTNNIDDSWSSMSSMGFSQVDNAPFAGPGHWNNPDMLVLGWIGWGQYQHQTDLTPSEQYTHMSLWCLLSAPLLLGCDLEQLDPFTLNLITNDEVIAIDQDPLGKQARLINISGDIQVWAKEMDNGSKAVGIFNLGELPLHYNLQLESLGMSGTHLIRNVWKQKDLGEFEGSFEAIIPVHGVELVEIK